jgi:phosphoribosyl 1,2-cyclic phosphate phosphodiesterase
MHSAGQPSVFNLTFLGTGTSTGIPVIGCDCDICRSTDPRDTRLRSSALIRTDHATILIDTSPDLRAQLLRTRATRIDAVLYTHAHADHTAGLDELRQFNVLQQARIPVWAETTTAQDIAQRFAYAVDHTFSWFGGKPDIDLHVFSRDQPFLVAGIKVQPIPIMHGTLPIVGFRIGQLGYLTDMKSMTPEAMDLLRDLDVLVLTALRTKPHPAHLSLSEALDVVTELAPRRAFLTHLSHDMGHHADVAVTLPDHVRIAEDGLVVSSIALVDDDDRHVAIGQGRASAG